MIKLIELSLQNVRSFTEKQTITFDGRGKLIQVDGRNENTGGSSGAGKTSVFMALDYLLGLNAISATVLQSRLTKDPIEVSGKFQINQKEVVIIRSKKGGLSILFPETPENNVTGNVKLAEEKLDELIGIPRNLFKKLVHKKQKEGGFFLNMTPKEMYNFLITMLGLQEYVDKVDQIAKDIKEVKGKVSDWEISIEALKQQLRDFNEIKENKIKPECNITEEILNNYIVDIEKEQKLYDHCQEKRVAELAALKPPENVEDKELIDLKEEYTLIESKKERAVLEYKQKYDKMQQAHNNLVGELSSCKYAEEKIEQYKEQITELNKDKKILEAALCPTCNREWVGEDVENKLNAVKEKIQAIGQEALQCKKTIDKKSEIEANIERLAGIFDEHKKLDVSSEFDSKLSDLRASIKQKEQQYLVLTNEYHKKKEAINKKYDESVSNNMLETKKNEYTQVKAQFDNFKINLANYEAEVKKLNEMREVKKQDIIVGEQAMSDLTKKVEVAEEAKRLIKTYTLQTFQDTLDLIGEVASETMSGIPNMATSSIYFEGCKENKSGTIKDEVTPIVTMDGAHKVPIKSLSGGERTAIDLAVDLAVIDTIESKAGIGADFFVIDEPFDGLDSVCKENCLELLKQIDTNKRIVMVDHSSELKEMVSEVITVVKSGENSRIL